MPIVPLSPPQAVPGSGGFDYVTVDSVRRRVYAAHVAARSLLIVDADTGKILSQVKVGPLHGVAVDARTGHVFTGNGDAHTVSEIDPATKSVVRTIDVGVPVDAIAYDGATKHIYADEDDGNHVVVIDMQSFKVLGKVTLPGHKLEYLSVDPQSRAVYQNIGDRSAFAVIDPESMKVTTLVPTPGLTNLHPLQYDATLHSVVTVGANGVMGSYHPAGKPQFTLRVPKGIDQCDLDRSLHMIACAGLSGLSVFDLGAKAGPRLIGTLAVGKHVHTVGVDAKTHHIWAVWGSKLHGDFIERFSASPLPARRTLDSPS